MHFRLAHFLDLGEDQRTEIDYEKKLSCLRIKSLFLKKKTWVHVIISTSCAYKGSLNFLPPLPILQKKNKDIDYIFQKL